MRSVALLAVAVWQARAAEAALSFRSKPRSLLAGAGATTKHTDEAAHNVGEQTSAAVRASGSARAHAASRFDSLAACSAAYEELQERRCKGDEGSGVLYSLSHGWPWQARGGLVDDEQGNRLIVKSAPMKVEGRILYAPPMSYSGRPSATGGWDYRRHGDDWSGLGNCGGPDQSPVDLHRHVGVKGLTKFVLWFDYYLDPNLNSSHTAYVENDGHGLRYQAQPNGIDLGFVKVGAEEYTAAEYVLHTPSEHTIDGAVFPAELQIYNRAKSGAIVAISVFFREGGSNPFLAAMMKSMGGKGPRWTLKDGRAARGPLHGTLPAAFDLEKLIPKGDAARERAFFNYKGSMTQPPCKGGVDWWVLSSPVAASREELRFVKGAIYGSRSSKHGNARATVPLGNRQVMAGLVGFQHAVKDRQFPGWASLDEAVQPRGYNGGDMPWGPHWVPKDAKNAGDDEDEEDEEDHAKDMGAEPT